MCCADISLLPISYLILIDNVIYRFMSIVIIIMMIMTTIMSLVQCDDAYDYSSRGYDY